MDDMPGISRLAKNCCTTRTWNADSPPVGRTHGGKFRYLCKIPRSLVPNKCNDGSCFRAERLWLVMRAGPWQRSPFSGVLMVFFFFFVFNAEPPVCLKSAIHTVVWLMVPNRGVFKVKCEDEMDAVRPHNNCRYSCKTIVLRAVYHSTVPCILNGALSLNR